jgi:Rieske 2Fe-2S family protein
VLYRFIPRSLTETDMELVWYVNGDAEEDWLQQRGTDLALAWD